jgi:Ser/Thr protein kinase RdoA (MazF antagonist)
MVVVGPFGGGNRNQVLEVRRGQDRLVARRSRRSAASLDWEIELLDYIASQGLRVPEIIPSLDGRRHVGGVVVQSWLDGSQPGPDDWPAVATTLQQLHALTAGLPQRPGFASTRQLLTVASGGDVDLSAMPRDVVDACRAAWRRLAGIAEAVVHGDPGPANIRITTAGVGLLDWDEARVDYVDLDLAELPVAVLPPARLTAGRAAATAWETANGWIVEPLYARRQLAKLKAGRDAFN